MAWRVLMLLGRPWLTSLLREVTVAADTKAPPDLETARPDRRFLRACPTTSRRRKPELERPEIDQLDHVRIDARPRKIAPTRAKRSGESVAKKRTA